MTKKLRGSNQFVDRIQKPIKVYHGTVHTDTIKLGVTRKLDRFEGYFRNFTMGAVAIFLITMASSIIVESLGVAMAHPAVVEVPYESKRVPPIMQRIAKCESGGKHFDSKGKVIRGKVDKNDIGKYQISLTHHAEQAKKMGIDLFNEKGNEEYAMHLYHTTGTELWYKSKRCWNK